LFQSGDEHTLDYCNYLKMLMIKIDPNCSVKWRKHKFKQKFFIFFFLLISLFLFLFLSNRRFDYIGFGSPVTVLAVT
jgi:hypothetical protein